MRKTQVAFTILLAALTGVASLSTAAAPPTALLGSEGEIYRLVRMHASSGDPYLLLTVQRVSGTTEMAVVPETEGPGNENSPYLIYDHGSQTVFLAWEERVNYIHSLIRLVGYRDGQWTQVIEVSEGSFGFKGEPRLAATQDSFAVALPDGGTRVVARTVLHVVWVEERSEGQLVAYAPVTLLDGQYVGQRRIFDLASLVVTEEPVAADLWSAAAPAVAAGADDHSIIVGLIDPDSGRLASLRVTMLSGEISMIADELRGHLIDVGVHHDWQTPEGLTRLADELRGHLIDVGYRLDPQILRQVADGLRGHLIDVGARYAPDELRRLANDLRGHLIDVGFRLDSGGLRRVASASSGVVIEVAPLDESGEEIASSMTQIAEITVTGEWVRPNEAVAGSTLLISRSGQAALLSWTDGQAVYYRETFGDEWSPVVRLPLGDTLDAEQASGLLQDRIRNR